MPRRWRGSRRSAWPPPSSTLRATRFRGSTLAPHCCAGWARCASPIRRGSGRRRGRGISSIIGARNGGPLGAAEILRNLLVALGPIWPGRISLDGVPLGDCGRHPAVPGDGLVPFHKLSQWLAYSLVEPLAAGGIEVGDLDGLTGLAEYRNGGLFIDCGVIVPRDPGAAARSARCDERAGRRVAGVDRGIARSPGAAGARAARQKRARSFRSPACSKAAAGRRAAKSRSSAGRTAAPR